MLYKLEVELIFVVVRRSPKSEAGAKIAVYYAVSALETATTTVPALPSRLGAGDSEKTLPPCVLLQGG